MRVVGDRDLAKLIQRVQSTCIANGTELEKILLKEAASCATVIDRGEVLDDFIAECNASKAQDGAYLATKSAVKASKLNVRDHEPDFIVFVVSPTKRHCYIIEMKDGYEFDTKKAPGELDSLMKCQYAIAPLIPFSASIHMCSFNQLDKGLIVSGFKNVFSPDQVMTGEEFCEILGISYKGVLATRQEDTDDNLAYFLDELMGIEVVRTAFENAGKDAAE